MQQDAMLYYKRKAVKQKDGCTGLLYVHVWQTGWQELIFPTHEHAEFFARVETREGRPTICERTLSAAMNSSPSKRTRVEGIEGSCNRNDQPIMV